MSDFYGLPSLVLENEHLRLEYLAAAGPRIVRLGRQNQANLFAELPDFRIETPLGPYSFLGGHRLWRSPELMPETYTPDGEGVVVEKIEQGVRLTQASATGISKSIEVRLAADRAAVSLAHRLSNAGSGPVTLAPWALTMFRLGGVAILPQPVGNADPQGLLPNRFTALWPYTQVNDPRLTWRDDFVLIHAAPALPPVKIGYLNPHGWLAYWLDGTLFRKVSHPAGGPYPDGGCNAESYCNDKFVELETLGALVTLEPGASTDLAETWELYSGLDVPFLTDEVRAALTSLA
ncbi:MAG TPA: hypothetical protein VMC09_15095 [Anaerolineales bacterium]|nr:hypothetical protein [Anaerolineales bacterium]